jgi:O-acetyl-ADP-ribose deacetylase (regulator of RNase III)
LREEEKSVIGIVKGNLLEADVEALVNTVNCVGHMGKGIALQFKKAYPDNYMSYRRACDQGYVMPGRMHVFETGNMYNPKYIINFPTKRHWKGRSRMEDIEAGLNALSEELRGRGIRSIAVPPLGCGLGGLNWTSVRQLIEQTFAKLPDVQVMLYPPSGTPGAKTMPIGTRHPRMTAARALLIKVMEQYNRLTYRLTLLEIQKMAYFLQEAGEPLRLRYEAGRYGPYAHNLNKVLEILEGHFIRGYGDNQKPDVEIDLLEGSAREADLFLARQEDSVERLKRVSSLIEGFETPYGMELLSSVHWVARHHRPPASGAESAIKLMYDWNDRKRGMFRPDHIEVAWQRLREAGWLT